MNNEFSGKGFGPLEKMLSGSSRNKTIQSLVGVYGGLMHSKKYNELFDFAESVFERFSSDYVTVRQWDYGATRQLQYNFTESDMAKYCAAISSGVVEQKCKTGYDSGLTALFEADAPDMADVRRLPDALKVTADPQTFKAAISYEGLGKTLDDEGLLDCNVVIDGLRQKDLLIFKDITLRFKHYVRLEFRDRSIVIAKSNSGTGVMGERASLFGGIYYLGTKVYKTIPVSYEEE